MQSTREAHRRRGRSLHGDRRALGGSIGFVGVQFQSSFAGSRRQASCARKTVRAVKRLHVIPPPGGSAWSDRVTARATGRPTLDGKAELGARVERVPGGARLFTEQRDRTAGAFGRRQCEEQNKEAQPASKLSPHVRNLLHGKLRTERHRSRAHRGSGSACPKQARALNRQAATPRPSRW